MALDDFRAVGLESEELGDKCLLELCDCVVYFINILRQRSMHDLYDC